MYVVSNAKFSYFKNIPFPQRVITFLSGDINVKLLCVKTKNCEQLTTLNFHPKHSG